MEGTGLLALENISGRWGSHGQEEQMGQNVREMLLLVLWSSISHAILGPKADGFRQLIPGIRKKKLTWALFSLILGESWPSERLGDP